MYLPEKNYSDSVYSVNIPYDYDLNSPFVHKWGSDTFSFTTESTTSYFYLYLLPCSIITEGNIVSITLSGTEKSGSLGSMIYISVEETLEGDGYTADVEIIAKFTVKHPNIPGFKYVVIVGIIVVIDFLLINKIITKLSSSETKRLQYKY